MTNLVGDMLTPTLPISWSINRPPIDSNGVFIVEVSDTPIFTSISTSGTVEYVTSQLTYNINMVVTGNYGDMLYYRVVNEKRYKTLCDSIIKSIKYSEIIPIKIGISSINNY
jgi:hypothetical protein